MNGFEHKERLIARVASGDRVRFLHFWGHRPSADGVGRGCLSQWWACRFDVDGAVYRSAEHWMMAEKARLFEDHEMRRRILASGHPGEAKKLGRGVRGFDEGTWRNERFEIVVRGNVAKFSQNTALGEFLAATSERILVEASPRDRIWGTGLAADHADAENPAAWPGLNLLGFALMEARERLS